MDYNVTLGTTTDTNEPNAIHRKVQRVVRTPYARDHDDDIALLMLDSVVHYTNTVRPICLPPTEDDANDEDEYYDQYCRTAGWSANEGDFVTVCLQTFWWSLLIFQGETNEVFKHLSMPKLSEGECSSYIPIHNITCGDSKYRHEKTCIVRSINKI